MVHYIVISDVPPVALALRKVIKTLFTDDVDVLGQHDCIHVSTIKRDYDLLARVNAYTELAAWIEEIMAAGQEEPQQVIACVSVLTDKMEDFDPITRHSSASIIGMLILTFPEIEWVVGNGMQMPIKEPVSIRYGTSQSQKEGGGNGSVFTSTLVQAVNSVLAGHSPLFDGSGLRDALYSVIRVNKAEAWYLPARRHLALTIDDECSYAHFTAYVAYRFGFRCYALSTLRMMDDLLLIGGTKNCPKLLMEDIYLNFSDRRHGLHLSKLRVRDGGNKDRDFKGYQPLSEASLRVIISSGGGEEETWKDNLAYLNSKFSCIEGKMTASLEKMCKDKRWWVRLNKPFSGVFDLYKQSRMNELIKKLNKNVSVSCFKWPPDKSRKPSDGKVSHSCAGALRVVAERLVERAEWMQSQVHGAVSAVHGAILSTMACELLGCRTPTVALEALSLKHYFEALAECQFYGVQSTVDVRRRLVDLGNEVGIIGECFDSDHRDVAVLNGKAAIVDVLVQLYREQNQFDEEQACLYVARKWHRKAHRKGIWMQCSDSANSWLQKIRCGARGVITLPANWLLWYLHLCLRSLSTFLLILLGWVVFWSVICLLMRHQDPVVGGALTVSQTMTALAEGFGLMFGANTLTGLSGCFELVNVFGVLTSFVHVGIFITYLYSIGSRR